MASYVKYNIFVEQLAKGVQDFASDTYKVALTNTAPTANTDVTFSTGLYPAPLNANGYPSGGETVTGLAISSSLSGGTTNVSANQVQFTATGTLGPFRYVILYNFTEATNNLVAYWDYGTVGGITLSTAGDTFTVKFSNANPGTIFSVT